MKIRFLFVGAAIFALGMVANSLLDQGSPDSSPDARNQPTRGEPIDDDVLSSSNPGAPEDNLALVRNAMANSTSAGSGSEATPRSEDEISTEASAPSPPSKVSEWSSFSELLFFLADGYEDRPYTWLRQHLSSLAPFLQTAEGMEEFLEMLDGDLDPRLLSGMMYLLGSEGLPRYYDRIHDIEALEEEIWKRLQAEEDGHTQRALLHLLAHDPRTIRSRLDDFRRLAESSSDPSIRALAIAALGKVSSEEGVEQTLLAFIEGDHDPGVRRAALTAILNSPQLAQPVYEKALYDPDVQIRSLAIRFYAPPTPEAKESFQNLLEEELVSTQDYVYKVSLIERLTEYSPSALHGYLSEMLITETNEDAVSYYKSLISLLDQGITRSGDLVHLTTEKRDALLFSASGAH